MFKNNKHTNIYLQNVYNKYGFDVLSFEILEMASTSSLLIIEQKYIDELGVCDKKIGYNIAEIAGSPMAGKKHTEETKKHLSDVCGGENHWAYGKKQTEEHNRKISQKNKKYNDEQEKEMYMLFLSGVSYSEIQRRYKEKHLQTIIMAVRRVERFDLDNKH